MWVIEVPGRPETTSAWRRMDFHARADYSRLWRHAAFALSKEAKIPALNAMHIVVRPVLTSSHR